jgi:hypothetical protein
VRGKRRTHACTRNTAPPDTHVTYCERLIPMPVRTSWSRRM